MPTLVCQWAFAPTVCVRLLLEESQKFRMASRFDPHLVNDPFGDPAVYVDLKFERRAFLFDLGDISVLPPRKLLRISDIFITHRHMDHFVGFDHLLRFVLGREKVVRFYGPAGLIDAIEAKLRAYTWNLVGGYDGHVVLHVAEQADGLGVGGPCWHVKRSRKYPQLVLPSWSRSPGSALR